MSHIDLLASRFRNLPSAMQYPEEGEDAYPLRPLPTSETNVTLLFDDDAV